MVRIQRKFMQKRALRTVSIWTGPNIRKSSGVGVCKKSKISGNMKKYYNYMGDSKKIDFEVREISDTDLQRGFFDTLSNLTEVGKISEDHESAKKVLHEIRSYPFYKVFVAVKKDGEIIGSNTLLIEQKFIHNGGRVGHIEDVATKKGYEGMGIGRALVGRSLRFAAQMKCYKVLLDCSEKNVPFYKKIGFKECGLSMRYDLL
jgi:glucosamine-phosphate N-acetyltransferase